VFLALFAGVGVCAQDQPTETALVSQVTPKPCEVTILGLVHEYTGRSYGPAHLRAIYEAVHPSIIAIEATASSVKSGMPIPPLNENFEAIDYGRRTGTRVTGVDWDWEGPPPAGAPDPKPPRAAGISEKQARRLEFSHAWLSIDNQKARLADIPDELAYLNNPVTLAVTRSQVQHHSPYPGFDVANDTIAKNIRTIAREQCVGGRLLVTFGGAHKSELEDRLSSAPELHIRPITDWLPLSPAAVAAQTQPADLWKIMQMTTENLEMLVSPADMPFEWLREQAGEMEQRARSDPEAKYYLARWLTVSGEWDRAAKLLSEVQQDAEDRKLSIYNPATIGTAWFFPPEIKLKWRALFALGLVQDLAGHRQEAITTYQTIKAEIDKSGVTAPPGPGGRPRDLRGWVDHFLAEPYTGHPDQYLRILIPD